MPDSFKQSANALTLRLIATGLARLCLTTVRITILIRKDVDGHWQQTGTPPLRGQRLLARMRHLPVLLLPDPGEPADHCSFRLEQE